MNEENVILQLTRKEGGVSVETHSRGIEDLYAIAYTFAHLCKDTPILVALMLQAMDDVRSGEDPAVEMPDFDKILKDNK